MRRSHGRGDREGQAVPPLPERVAPAVGFEPTTKRLTAARSTTELRRNDPIAWGDPRRRGGAARQNSTASATSETRIGARRRVSEQSLNGAWQLRLVGAGEWLPGIVPGGVHLDLMAAGRILDPFVGDEEVRVGWVAESDWEYRREFEVEAAVAAEERVALVFDGLDTLADLRLNGEPLGSADNMFRKWQFDVTGRLRPSANELSVVFRSAVRHAAELDSGRHLASANDQLPGAPYLRKAPCHFGWDWGPKLPNIGFWQGVRLEGSSTARLADVRVEQTVKRGTGGANTRGRISARVDVERTGASGAGAGPIEAVLRVAHPDRRTEVVRAPIDPDRTSAELAVEIAAPELWWPNGLGKQPLYEIEVELAAGGQRRDARSFK